MDRKWLINVTPRCNHRLSRPPKVYHLLFKRCTLKLHLYQVFYFKAVWPTNPSGLLTNLLRYFQFWFWIRWDILFVHSAYSQDPYRFVPHSQYTNRFSVHVQFHSTYPVNTHSKNLFKNVPPSAYSLYTYRFTQHILSKVLCTDSFRIFANAPT